jgi:hypothetical protein
VDPVDLDPDPQHWITTEKCHLVNEGEMVGQRGKFAARNTEKRKEIIRRSKRELYLFIFFISCLS